MKKLGLYVHIPFCLKKCNYCNFNSYENLYDLVPEYFDSLKLELLLYESVLVEYSIDTIFFGGGTPNSVDVKFILDFICDVFKNFNVDKDLEITIECNPSLVRKNYMSDLYSVGVNRISLGLQSTNNSRLRRLGRLHDVEVFDFAYNVVKNEGFSNISVDLMFGLPDQNLQDFEAEICDIFRYEIQHLSLYALTIEKNTPFYNDKSLVFASHDEQALMYEKAVEILRNNGYKRYEISNFATPSFYCKHNLKYWNFEEYLGLGAGASSFFKYARWTNKNVVCDFIKDVKNNIKPVMQMSLLSTSDAMSEFMYLGLRTEFGVSISSFKSTFDKELFSVFGSTIYKFIEGGFIKRQDDRIFLADEGYYVSNQIFSEFLN